MRDYCRDKFLPVALPLNMMSKLHFVSEVQIHFCILVTEALMHCRVAVCRNDENLWRAQL